MKAPTVTDRFAALDQQRARLQRGGGPDKLAKQHRAGKLGARERLGLLFDPDSFVEFGLWAHRRARWRPVRSCRATASSPARVTSAGGPSSPSRRTSPSAAARSASCTRRRSSSASRRALKCGVPVVGFNDSGGARIQEGVEALSGYGQIFYHNTLLSGRRPADLRHRRPLRRRRRLLPGPHRLRDHGRGHRPHVHRRARGDQGRHRRGDHRGGPRRRRPPTPRSAATST